MFIEFLKKNIMKTFLKQLLGDTDLSIYLARILSAFTRVFRALVIRLKPNTDEAIAHVFIGLGPSYFGATSLIQNPELEKHTRPKQ
jgi:hypothetical protein